MTKKHEDELQLMGDGEGIFTIPEHSPEDLPTPKSEEPPMVTEEMRKNTHLWVVRKQDAVHAHELCDFGKMLTLGKVKHTNLTGGDPAFCGGELLWIGPREILVNGCSGRYGPQSKEEMQTAEHAFAKAGYRVWTTGYDEDTGYTFRFGTSIPIMVNHA